MLDRREAGRLVVAVILMQTDGDVLVHLGGGLDHAAQHEVAGIGACPSAGLDDHRRAGLVGGRHDRQQLLHVVDVEGRHAVAVLGGVVQQLAKRDQRHQAASSRASVARAR